MSFIRLRRYAPYVPLVALAVGGVALLPADPDKAASQAAVARVEAPQPSYLAVPIATVDPALLKAVERKASVVRPSLTVTTAAASAPALDQPPAAGLPEETAEPETNVAHVGGSALNVRAGPSSSTAKLFVLQPGTKVAAAESEGKWVRIITPDGQEGWVFGRYLNTGEPAAAKPKVETASVKTRDEPAEEVRKPRTARIAGRVELRSSPSRLSQRLFVLEPGERVAIAERRGNWARVVVDGGVSGWVRIN